MNIIVDSLFKPMTYAELTLPLFDYKAAYEQVEQDYSDLVALTEAWKDKANRENSPEAYAMYLRYSDLLNAIVDDFSRGMNSRNRSQLIGMKRGYALNITPVAEAYEAMKKANEFRETLGPDAIFEVAGYNSIDDFLHGKTANNKFESRKDITARTALMALSVANSILNDPEIKNSMSPLFLEIIEKKGLGSLEELEAAIAGNPKAMNKFAKIKQSMIDLLGGLYRFDEQGLAAVNGAINEGLYTGLNNYAVSLLANGEYRSASDRDASARGWAQINLARREYNDKRAKEKKAEHDSIYGTLLGVDPDGTEHWGNNVSRWTKTPTGQTLKKTPDGKYVYQDDKGKIYYSEVSSKSGKVVVNKDKKKLTPVMATSYKTEMTKDLSNMIPETDANGNYTGRYWDTELKKYVSEDKNITTQGNYKDGTNYTPLFFSAWSKGATKSFALQNERTNKGMMNDWGQISWGNIRGGEAKTAIKNYVRYLTGLPDNYELPDNVMEKVTQYIIIERDQNWMFDNNFAVRIRGVDDEGKVVNQSEFERAKKAVSSILKPKVASHSLPKK